MSHSASSLTFEDIKSYVIKELGLAESGKELQSAAENHSFKFSRLVSVLEEFFLKTPLPQESLRDPQVAISVMNVRQVGVEMFRQLASSIASTIVAHSEIQLLNARADAQVRMDEAKAKLQSVLGKSGSVSILGQSFLVSDLVDAIENRIPRQLAEVFLGTVNGFDARKSTSLGDHGQQFDDGDFSEKEEIYEDEEDQDDLESEDSEQDDSDDSSEEDVDPV